MGGVANSRPTATSGSHGCSVVGIDTLRVRFRGAYEQYEAMRRIATADGARGEARAWLGPASVGAFPDGMVWAEARPMAVLHGRDDHRLATAADALAATDQVAAWLREAGVDVPATAAVGRVDLAAELRFDRPDEGHALLRAARMVDLPWLKAGAEGMRRDHTETVYWRTGRSVVLRLYDKGIEAGTDPAGTRLRLERQQRFRKSREATIDQLAGGDLGELYAGRYLRGFLDSDAQLHVVSPAGCIDRLRDLAAIGAIGPRLAESLAGFVQLRGAGLPERTVYRRWSQLRRLGLTVDSASSADVVPFASYVRSCVDAWAA